MLSALRSRWLTALAVFIAALMIVFAVAGAVFGSDPSAPVRTALALVFGLLGAALLGGLRLLHTERPNVAAYALIVPGLLAFGVGFFWLLLVPTALALVVLVFGVVRGGLARELRRT